MPQVIRSPKQYDVCIIGSGAGGGTAAKVLTEGGLSVAMLEAGPALNPEQDYKEHLWPYDLPHRGVGFGGKGRHELSDEFLAGSGRESLADVPITGGGSLCASLPLISRCVRPTVWAMTGRSVTKTSLLTMTKSRLSLASTAPRRIFPARRTASLCGHPHRDVPTYL
jgi:choline dehydrogenase-like flavoprotein